MSALLPIDAVELNLNAEYGYTTREFSKVPNVYLSANYKSCLFLVYHQLRPIENRIKNYRNHFTLFRNETSIIIARTETTLIHADNDAIITYDVITPSENVSNRYRSTFKNWIVSFDKITYSSSQPDTFIGYTLIGSGEWWFYDNGVILNGISGYRENTQCQSLFIYYELHIDHKITISSKESLISMPPNIEVILKLGRNSQQNATPATTNAPQSIPTTEGSEEQNQQQATPNQPSFMFQANPDQQQNNSHQQSNGLRSIPLPSFSISSLPSSLLPQINASSRSIVRCNDNYSAKDIINKSVIPSLFWFDARCSELSCSNIEYFRPKDFKCASELKSLYG